MSAKMHPHARPYRFCPHCGGRLGARQLKPGDPERLVCDSCAEVLYLDPKVAVGTIIRDRAGRIVLVQRAIEPGYGRWVFPGGYVDRGEPLEAAAVREALEECGLDVRLDGLVDVYSYPNRTPVIIVYAATVLGGELRPDDEGLEARWFDRADIPWDSLAFPSTEQALRGYLRGRIHALDGPTGRQPASPSRLLGSASAAATPVPLDAILDLREDYRREMDCQIVHDSWHARGFTESYLLSLGDRIVGYGSVGGTPGEPRDIVKEFFVVAEHRGAALPLFRRLVAASGARTIEAQTNDVLLSLMLYDCADDVRSDTVLFADAITTDHPAPQVTLRRLTSEDRERVFRHTLEPVGDWGLEHRDEVVATGGILFHYNPPYGDVYMEVSGEHRRRGLGSYLVQELKRICRDMGRIPAARCHRDNHASRLTLERAGMFPCGRILRGRIAT